MFKFTIHSGDALIIYIGSMFVAYVLTMFKPSLPFLAFATQLTIAFTAFIAKRHFTNKLNNTKETLNSGGNNLITTGIVDKLK